LTVFDELCESDKTVAEVAKLIRQKLARWSLRPDGADPVAVIPRRFIIDPSARNRSHVTGRSTQWEYTEHGISTVPGQNAVLPGINRVKERLQAGKLVVTANCRELQKQFDRYRWEKPRRVEGDPNENPVKARDDLMDPLRYVCMDRPLTPSVKAVEETETLKDRMLRQALKQQGLGRVNHPSGPGVFL
jgi:hypothetical protein